MSLTKVQPSAIDASQNYSVNTLAANTVTAGGVNLQTLTNNVASFANGAFTQANTGVTLTTSAYARANTNMINSFLLMGA